MNTLRGICLLWIMHCALLPIGASGDDAAGSGTAANAAQPVTLQLDGKTYHHLEFIATNGETITFESDEGPVIVKWAELPEPLRQRFATNYADAMKQQVAVSADTLDVGRVTAISGTVVEKLSMGLIVNWDGQPILVTDHPDQAKLAAGDRISISARRTGLYEYPKATGPNKLIRKFKAAPQTSK